MTIKTSKETFPGLVLAVFGQQVEVEDEQGNTIHCHLRKNAEPIVPGDKILFELGHDHAGIVVEHLPRQSLFYKPEGLKKIKLIAANVDVVVIVTSPSPPFSEYLTDRYLVAAHYLKIQPVILLNKTDLLNAENRPAIDAALTVYHHLNYPILYSSIYTSHGLDELTNYLNQKTAVLVGASGVGKSSIIAALTKNTMIKTGETASSGTGKHTTTTTRLYHLNEGGHLIDSPGVREFSLGKLDKEHITAAFKELTDIDCQFRNCQHQKEPGCGLPIAIEEGKLSAKRLANYQTMLNECSKKDKYSRR